MSTRTTLFLSVVAVLGAGCSRGGGLESPEGARVHPWPMFRGQAHHRGYFPNRPTPQLREAWRQELGERVDASPLIDDRGRVWVVSRKGALVAFEGATGRRVFERRLPSGVWSTPVLFESLIILADQKRQVRAYDLESGRPQWSFGAPSPSFSALSLSDGRVHFCSGQWLIALAAREGTELWRKKLSGRCFTAPAIAGGRVVVADRAGKVFGLRKSGGETLWQATTSLGADNDGSATIAGDSVFLGSNDQHIYAFDLVNGDKRWSQAGRNWFVSTPAIGQETLYIGDDGGRLRALRASTGEELWRAQVGDDLASSPTVIGRLVVHGAHDGKVYGHRSESGESLPPLVAGAAMYASVAVHESGRFFIATHEGSVLAVD